MHPNIDCSTIRNKEEAEATYLSIDRGLGKKIVYVYSEILLSHKKEQNNTIRSNMDGPRLSII